MWPFFLSDKNKTPLNVQTGLDGKPCLITEGLRVLAAHWQSIEITTATTTTIIETLPGRSILLTDLIVTLSKKVASATIIPCFDDGATIENLFTFDASTNPFQFSHPFQGGLRGWKEANFLVVTNTATNVSVLAGYVQMGPEQTKTYSAWNAER